MKKKIDFNTAAKSRLDDKIEKTLNREFAIPQNVEAAKKDAFDEILSRTKQTDGAKEEKKNRKWQGLRSGWTKGLAGLAAAAAAFSMVCISNPALAANIPLVGHVFEEIGSSLGFSGDYSKYAKPLSEDASAAGQESSASGEASAAGQENGAAGEASAAGQESGAAENVSAEEQPAADGEYTKTVDGVTVTLSEIYCNDAALYISMLIESEEAFPETLTDQEGKPAINLYGSKMAVSFQPELQPITEYLDGEFVDEHTYAGVLRIDLEDINKRYDEATGEVETLEIPEEFDVELSLAQIVGDREDRGGLPEMPQELTDEYNAGLDENGLDFLKGEANTDPEVYDSLTDEQKEIEHKLYNAMWNSYYEMYPEAAEYPNKYTNWTLEGPWNFKVDVKKNHEDTVVKEINDTDENGLGVTTVTKTPFEITVDTVEPDFETAPSKAGYFVAAVDANGDLLPYGSGGRTNVWAIQDRDVSKIDIYICDYIEYMDELKGYYWSDTYETDKETKTFKELLDERALHHTEVVFDE
ncbi:MAG: DUF4179 domain-containing protein [Eubacteriales bacterium]|nr:DUF4179 domain-containing protein [Eubacteriales bacterium]